MEMQIVLEPAMSCLLSARMEATLKSQIKEYINIMLLQAQMDGAGPCGAGFPPTCLIHLEFAFVVAQYPSRKNIRNKQKSYTLLEKPGAAY